MLTMLFCTAFGSTQQTECVDALSNTENSQYAFKLRFICNYYKWNYSDILAQYIDSIIARINRD